MVWHSLGSILVLPPIICRIPDILYFIRAVFYIFRSASHANHIYFLLIKKNHPHQPPQKIHPKSQIRSSQQTQQTRRLHPRGPSTFSCRAAPAPKPRCQIEKRCRQRYPAYHEHIRRPTRWGELELKFERKRIVRRAAVIGLR